MAAINSPEQRLWCAVVERAYRDATEDHVSTIGDAAQRERVRAEARLWFIENGHDLRWACEGAGLDPDSVREHALRLMAAADDRPAARRQEGGRDSGCVGRWQGE